MTPDDRIANALDRDLKRLPDHPAPATLVPSVMLQVRRMVARPWWQRAWFEWPASARAMSVLMAGTILWMVFAAATGSETAGPLQPLFALLSAIGLAIRATATATCTALFQAIQSIPSPLLATMLITSAAAWAACFGLCAICLRYVRIRR